MSRELRSRGSRELRSRGSRELRSRGSREFALASGETPFRLAVEVVLARDGAPGHVACSFGGRVVRVDAVDPADFTPHAAAIASGAGVHVTDLRWRR